MLESDELRRVTTIAAGLVLAALLAVLVASGVALVGVEESARAAFPGKNGKIAFTSDRAGDYGIYTMNPDGTGVSRLTKNSAFDGAPDWQPLP
jgi:Tol biopolymer transport system component